MFFLILILAVFIILLWPLIRILWEGYKLHKRWKEATAGMRGAYDGRHGSEPQAPVKRKVIDPSVGEYVEFEEIAATETQQTDTGITESTTETISQIEDIEWDDLPNEK